MKEGLLCEGRFRVTVERYNSGCEWAVELVNEERILDGRSMDIWEDALHLSSGDKMPEAIFGWSQLRMVHRDEEGRMRSIAFTPMGQLKGRSLRRKWQEGEWIIAASRTEGQEGIDLPVPTLNHSEEWMRDANERTKELNIELREVNPELDWSGTSTYVMTGEEVEFDCLGLFDIQEHNAVSETFSYSEFDDKKATYGQLTTPFHVGEHPEVSPFPWKVREWNKDKDFFPDFLTRTNIPIRYHQVCDLINDGLDDNGVSSSVAHLRVHDDFWYIKHRSLSCVDGVVVRAVDTRVLCEFAKPDRMKVEWRVKAVPVQESDFHEVNQRLQSAGLSHHERMDQIVDLSSMEPIAVKRFILKPL